MDGFVFVLFALGAMLSYKMPIFIARFIGLEPQINNLWNSAANDDEVSFILFLAAWMTIGFAAWAVPAFVVVRACRKENLLAVWRRLPGLLHPLSRSARPIFLLMGERLQSWEDQFTERQTLRTLYKSEFKEDFPSFKRFLDYYDKINEKGFIAPGVGFTASADPFQDAVILLGLEDEFKPDDLASRYRSLIRGVHPDVAGPNDVARRITDARDVIKARKGWR